MCNSHMCIMSQTKKFSSLIDRSNSSYQITCYAFLCFIVILWSSCVWVIWYILMCFCQFESGYFFFKPNFSIPETIKTEIELLLKSPFFVRPELSTPISLFIIYISSTNVQTWKNVTKLGISVIGLTKGKICTKWIGNRQ